MHWQKKINPDTIIEYGLISRILFTPLAVGSVYIWVYTIVEVLVLLLVLIFFDSGSARYCYELDTYDAQTR